MTHALQDGISLEIGRRVADRLQARPDLIEVAKGNLARWAGRNADAPSLLRCYEEWRGILARPLDEVCAILRADDEEARRLRQNSPFTGILSPAEVWDIKKRHRHATAPA